MISPVNQENSESHVVEKPEAFDKELKQIVYGDTYTANTPEPSGFWWSIDSYINKIGKSLGKSSSGKWMSPLRGYISYGISGLSKIWNSKIMTPIRISAKYIGEFLDKIKKHPLLKIGSIGYFIASGVVSIVAGATTGGVGAAVIASISFGAGIVSAISNIAITAHQKNKISSLKKQRDMLRIIQHTKEIQIVKLHEISKIAELQNIDKKTTIEAIGKAMTRQASMNNTHKRSVTAFSKFLAKNSIPAISALVGSGIESVGIIKDIAHAINHAGNAVGYSTHAGKIVTDSLRLVNSTNSNTESLYESGEVVNDIGLKHENELKKEINILSQNLCIPKMKNTAELAAYTRNVMNDTEAMIKITKDGKLDEFGIQEQFLLSKSAADKEHGKFDFEKRASFARRIANAVAHETVGTTKEWKQPASDIKEQVEKVKKELYSAKNKSNSTKSSEKKHNTSIER